MEKVLDGQGLAEVWRRIKDRSIPVKGMSQNEYKDLSPEEKEADVLYVVGQIFYYKGVKIGGGDGGSSFTTDGTLNMSEDNVLSVATPVQPFTQEQYEKLTDDEKQKSMLCLVDEPPWYPTTLSVQEYDTTTDDGVEWHVRKWSDGYVEMSGFKNYGKLVLEYSGNVIYIAYISGMKYPFSLSTIYSKNFFASAQTYLLFISEASRSGTGMDLEKTETLALMNFKNLTVNDCCVTVYITGRWK